MSSISYKDKILKLRKLGYSYNQIIKELGCSKSTISYHCNNNDMGSKVKRKLDDDIIDDVNIFYKNNTGEETVKYIWSKYKIKVSLSTLKKYLKPKRDTGLSIKEKKKRNVKAVTKRRKKLKNKSIDYLGGKCSKCGYNKCINALETHHLNPEKKEFNLSLRGMTRSWEKIKKELDKCILVCANCHREIHYELNIPQ